MAKGAGEAEKAKQNESKWPGEPNRPLSSHFYSP
ncbi:hypothetical protein PVAP13_4KG375001 [Panicum virgatum]|uniref:Uncharacterized protein n=1 Tax=Panicum virgatum TaxID=38727 RepID=A0A8T0TZ11_PANVG|nr:hypothetical protein PVAP13_4KG375001 [Panicum virgatum]